MKRIISTSAAPAAVGPYSQGVEASGATLYVSGQLPIDPADGIGHRTVEQQTEQALRNVEAILREAGYSLSDVVKSVASDDNEGAVAWDIPVVKALGGVGFREVLHRRVTVYAVGPAGS